MPFNSDRHMRERTVPAIERGLAKAGRVRSDIEVIAEVIVAVGRTDEELERARGVKSVLAFYGSTPAYKPVLDVEGVGELQPELNALSKQGRWSDMTGLVSDDLMQTIGVWGTPGEVSEEIVRRFGDCDRICAYFPGYDAGLDLVAEFTAAVKQASARAPVDA
jgi:alkanesulfonate monooxygenase SsuD/methylene tetrahydromethanopterin reductase-like flavin-dependent oxidoreductase (luciferase family)